MIQRLHLGNLPFAHVTFNYKAKEAKILLKFLRKLFRTTNLKDCRSIHYVFHASGKALSEKTIYYIGIDKNAPTRFYNHNFSKVGKGNKRKEIKAHFKNNKKLGYTLIINNDPMNIRPHLFTQKTEGQLIRSLQKLKWNKNKGAKGEEKVNNESLIESLSFFPKKIPEKIPTAPFDKQIDALITKIFIDP